MRSIYDDEEEQESFFVSMTDIMVGLLFIFILLVVYFVTQVRIVAEENTDLREQIDETDVEVIVKRKELDQYRSNLSKQQIKILEGLKSFFEREGFSNVKIDEFNLAVSERAREMMKQGMEALGVIALESM